MIFCRYLFDINTHTFSLIILNILVSNNLHPCFNMHILCYILLTLTQYDILFTLQSNIISLIRSALFALIRVSNKSD